MSKERDDTTAGLATICAVVGLCAFLIGCIPGCKRSWDAAGEEAAAYQRKHDQWEGRCRSRGGQVVYNGKGSPAYLCFGPDGRLLGTR